MQYFLEPYGGVWLVVAFLVFFTAFNYALGYLFANNFDSTKNQYLVADRKLNLWQASMSIGASWVWAPSMFISASKAYSEGWVAMVYFLGANTISLLIFAVLVNRICEKWSDGFTLSDYMGVQHSHRVRVIYWISLIGLTIGAFATQLFAGGNFIRLLTGMDLIYSTLLVAAVPLIYSIFFGFKSSVITDLTKMVMLLIIGIGTAVLMVNQVGVDTVIKGINGVTGEYTSLFDEKGWLVFSTFGLATMVGLLSAPFGDQALWQRAFATKNPSIRRNSFLLGLFFFILIPISMAIIGFAAAGAGFKTNNIGFVNLMFVIDQLPAWVVMAFAVMILAGITSILDSKLSAMSSIAGHDIAQAIWKNPTDKQSVNLGKTSMVVLCILSVLVANIPGITLVHLFLIYGSLRASTLLPTMLVMVTGKPLAEAGIFYGVLASLAFGVPILAYGALNKLPWITVTGSLGGLLLSGIIAYAWTKIAESRGHKFEFVPESKHILKERT